MGVNKKRVETKAVNKLSSWVNVPPKCSHTACTNLYFTIYLTVLLMTALAILSAFHCYKIVHKKGMNDFWAGNLLLEN